MAIKELKNKIEKKKVTIGVVGLGYVGLSLAVAFARAGFRVTGIDIDPAKVASINRDESYLPDVSSEELAALTSGGQSSDPASSAAGGARPRRLTAETDFGCRSVQASASAIACSACGMSVSS